MPPMSAEQLTPEELRERIAAAPDSFIGLLFSQAIALTANDFPAEAKVRILPDKRPAGALALPTDQIWIVNNGRFVVQFREVARQDAWQHPIDPAAFGDLLRRAVDKYAEANSGVHLYHFTASPSADFAFDLAYALTLQQTAFLEAYVEANNRRFDIFRIAHSLLEQGFKGRVRKFRCTKCCRMYLEFRISKDGRVWRGTPSYGLLIHPIDPKKHTYLLHCTKCGNKDLCVLPIAPEEGENIGPKA